MFSKLKSVENRYEELTSEMSDPVVIASDRYLKIVKEHSELEPVVLAYREYNRLSAELIENKELFTSSDDRDFRDLVREEIDSHEQRIAELEASLREMLATKDPSDNRSVIVEIRAGAGGEEAALFAAVLYRMYSYYASSKGWNVELVDVNETELGGFKEIVFEIDGQGAFSRLKYERGVHRVQRVPATESGGRIHTSTVTVAVLPEVDDVEVSINPNDLDIDTYRASGAGGQHVNKTDSAIRITHRPSGIVVTCQDQRSQYKNKDRAMAVLRSRLFEMEQSKRSGAIADERKSQVGTGDRSERIRTYNYHQGRVSDHRIGLTLYKIDEVLQGNLDEFINALTAADRANTLGKPAEIDAE
ncbi:MAG: peptide chain release factor 1 [Saccharofermentanales bacterium]